MTAYTCVLDWEDALGEIPPDSHRFDTMSLPIAMQNGYQNAIVLVSKDKAEAEREADLRNKRI